MIAAAFEIFEDVKEWRRDLHQEPELGFEVYKTAAFVARKLREFGCDEVVTEIGKTGVVGVVDGTGAGPTIGLRADMDALPILECSGVDWASKSDGVMHACGHDGHTAMLLGAAKLLTQSRAFNGRVALIFQPAEEGLGGAKAMLEDGLIERFSLSSVFGMHNMPGIDAGKFAIKSGPIMASASGFSIEVVGEGGHGALPHTTKDPIVAACAIVGELQTIVSRNTDPLQPLVISVGKIHGGEGLSVIPDKVNLSGTVRTLSEDITNLAEHRLTQISKGLAAAYDVETTLQFSRNYPVTVNHADQTNQAVASACKSSEDGVVDTSIMPIMAAEDFSFMLNRCPGAMIFLGNGDSANLHSPQFDFNDDILPYGMSYWVYLVHDVLKTG